MNLYSEEVLKTLLKANSGENFVLGNFQTFLKLFTLGQLRMFLLGDSGILRLGIVFGKKRRMGSNSSYNYIYIFK